MVGRTQVGAMTLLKVVFHSGPMVRDFVYHHTCFLPGHTFLTGLRLLNLSDLNLCLSQLSLQLSNLQQLKCNFAFNVQNT